MQKGRLYVFSGPSGAGKSTICRELVKDEQLKLSVSMTTRAPREGETDGVSYYFVSREKFQQTIDEGGFLEHASIYNNSYGTPKAPVMAQLEQGYDVILEIEMQGAAQVKKSYPDAVLVFVLPASMKVLRERLTARGTDSAEQVELRLSKSLEEIRTMVDYDYFLINDDLAQTLATGRAIITAGRHMVKEYSEEIIKQFEEEK